MTVSTYTASVDSDSMQFIVCFIGDIHSSSLLVSAEVRKSSGEICLSCLFSVDELIGCVGVIHSAQLESLTLTVLSVERSGEVNCTVGLMEGNHSVAVFGLSEGGLETSPTNVTLVSMGSQPPGMINFICTCS